MIREFNLIDHFCKLHQTPDATINIGPGDDMAFIQVSSGWVLAAVDQLVEGRHYQPGVTPLELVGRKAMTRCLSDVAAMAAKPLASLAAGVIPPHWSEDQAIVLFDAMHRTAAEFNCPLIGGDIAVHASPDHPLTLSVTVLATPGPVSPVRRSGAAVGDAVYVSGVLGGSMEHNGLGHHLTFTPRIQLALRLAETLGDRLHAMIDLSDGLGRDAGHMATASSVRIIIETCNIPGRHGISWHQAAGGGEDYELCFCASGVVPAMIDGVTITQIGRVEHCPSHGPCVVFHDNGHDIPGTMFGWEHTS